MGKLDLIKAIRTWRLEHKRNCSLEAAKMDVQMLEELGIIKIEIGYVRSHEMLLDGGIPSILTNS